MNHNKMVPMSKPIPPFTLPTTVKEFDSLTYIQRLALHDQYPKIYAQFIETKKTK